MDLFCGRGGWTRGLLAAGFRVVGVDLEAQPDYPAEATFLQANARTLDGRTFRGASVVVASPPCQGFSFVNRQVRDGRRPNPLDLELVCHALRIIGEAEPKYWAIENVQGALGWFRPIMGAPALRNPPWYIWGNFPGFVVGREQMRKMPKEKGGAAAWHNMAKGKRAALAAEIPAGLALPFAAACKEGLA